MVDVVTVDGPLPGKRLDWVARLYGPVDPKYARREFLEHLLTRSPAGPALHAFALDSGLPVAHCAVVPMRGRRGRRELRCGKVEALVVSEPYRGRRHGGPPLARTLLDRLFAHADERGLELLHAYVRPEVGRLFAGFEPLRVGEPSLVAVVNAESLRQHSLRARALARTQRAVAAAPLAAAQPAVSRIIVREATSSDRDLVDAPAPPEGAWTIDPDDAWDWYAASSVVRVIEATTRPASRGLVQLPASSGDALRIVGWCASTARARAAVRFLAAAARVAREGGAATLRYQGGDRDLGRACRLLGFARRSDFTTLYVRAHDPDLARPGAVVTTPLLYLGF